MKNVQARGVRSRGSSVSISVHDEHNPNTERRRNRILITDEETSSPPGAPPGARRHDGTTTDASTYPVVHLVFLKNFCVSYLNDCFYC